MNAFEYAAAATVPEASAALAGSATAEALAGGTDLLNRIKDGVAAPARVVYLKGITDPAFTHIQADRDGNVVIGAGVTLAALVASEVVAKAMPALLQATSEVGTPQIRNMATVGGNLCQRPRCWYYRHGHGIAGEAVAKLIREGDNRYHAIFMTDGPALFATPSSLAPPLIALGANAVLEGAEGSRSIAVAELFKVPKDEKDRELGLKPGEVLSRVVVPATRTANASYEARQKQAHDWPLVLASVSLEMEGEAVKKASIVLGAVGPVPVRATAAEESLVGKAVTLDSATAAAAAAAADAKPLSMNAYKVALVRTTVKRALMTAVGNRYWEA